MKICADCGEQRSAGRDCLVCGSDRTAPAIRPPSSWVIPPALPVILLAALLAVALWAVVAPRWNSNDYPKAEQTRFLQGCVGHGETAGTCQCALDKLESSYTVQQYDRFVSPSDPARDQAGLSHHIEDALAACRR
jgi:hypothetical protein